MARKTVKQVKRRSWFSISFQIKIKKDFRNFFYNAWKFRASLKSDEKVFFSGVRIPMHNKIFQK